MHLDYLTAPATHLGAIIGRRSSLIIPPNAPVHVDVHVHVCLCYMCKVISVIISETHAHTLSTEEH